VKTRIPQRFGFDPLRDIQVLCPMNRGGASARALNVALQAALNPPRDRKVERFGWTFAPGDKVMQTVNDYRKDVYNGDTGTITAVNTECTRPCRSTSRSSSPSSYIRHVMPSAPAAASLFSSKNVQRNASTVTWWRSAVRRSRGSRRTNCRIRSAACDALSRHCVRRVLWPPGFPLGSLLGSIGSAGT